MDATKMQMIARRTRRAGLGAGAAASLLRPAVRLAEQGLSAGPLLAKALEGLAKQVPRARMQPVLRKQRLHTEQAGQLVRQGAPARKGSPVRKESSDPKRTRDRLLATAADALREGVSAGDIEAFLSGLPEKPRRPPSAQQVTAAVVVLPDLLEAGSSPKAMRRLLTSAIEAGFGAESIRQLPSVLQGAHRGRPQPVGVLAEGAAKAIARGTPATRVLGGLFPGGIPGDGLPAGAGPPGTTPGVGKPPTAGPSDEPEPPGGPPGGES